MTKPTTITTNQRLTTTKRSIYQGPGTDTDQTVTYAYVWTDSRTGGNLPNWKNRIRNATSATTDLSGNRRQVEYGPALVSIKYFNGSQGQTVFRSVSGNLRNDADFPGPTTGISVANADSIALSKLVKNARAAQTTLNGMTALGELAETLRMIKSPAKALRTGIDRYLNLVKKRARQRRRVSRPNETKSQRKKVLGSMIAGTWLESAFGWTPLINDIESGAKALAERLHEDRRKTQVVVGYGKSESLTTSFVPNWTVLGLLSYRYVRSTTTRAEVKYLGAVKREVVNNRAVTSEIFGFRPRDFLPTVWELIPYSFLVDYFTNIGDIISAAAFHKSNFAWLQRTQRRSFIWKHDLEHDVQSAKATVQSNSGSGWYWISSDTQATPHVLTRSDVIRAPYSGGLIPDLIFEIPGMGSKKWLNLTALATGHASAKRSLRL